MTRLRRQSQNVNAHRVRWRASTVCPGLTEPAQGTATYEWSLIPLVLQALARFAKEAKLAVQWRR